MTVTDRPRYVNVLTPPEPPLPPEVRDVEVVSVEGPSGTVLAACQAAGTEEGYNWLVDTTGTVYELSGWDKASPSARAHYLIGYVLPVSPEQKEAMTWLLGQLARKKNVTEVTYSA